MNWQPIETAPKMKNLLLFAVTDVADDGRICNWNMDTGYWYHAYEDRREQLWRWGGRILAPYDVKPTHWMPLPEPPEEALAARYAAGEQVQQIEVGR